MGPTMSDHTWIRNGTSGESTVFGATQDNHWVIGVWDEIRADSWKLKDLVTGLDDAWLIQNGTVVYSPHELTSYAPRTAIGVTDTGGLVLVQVDGCEHCPFKDIQKRGVSLLELGTFMMNEMDALFAINLDGGGSASTVLNGRLVNRPTCLDYVSVKCERKVATAICVGKEQGNRDPHFFNRANFRDVMN